MIRMPDILDVFCMRFMDNPFQKPDAILKPPMPPLSSVASTVMGAEAARLAEAFNDEEEVPTDADVERDGQKDTSLRFSADEQGVLEQHHFFAELYHREGEKLRAFFGEEEASEVERLPDWVSYQRLQEWKKQGFEPHFLPKISVVDHAGEYKEFPGWEKTPYYGFLSEEAFDQRVTSLDGGWILWDVRKKPRLKTPRTQMYADDVFGPVIQQLRAAGVIQSFPLGGDRRPVPVDAGTRFGISWMDLTSLPMRRACAEVLSFHSAELIGLSTSLEANIMAHLHDPDWETTDATEWFWDTYRMRSNLMAMYGGCDLGNGNAFALETHAAHGQYPTVGFRYLVRLAPISDQA